MTGSVHYYEIEPIDRSGERLENSQERHVGHNEEV